MKRRAIVNCFLLLSFMSCATDPSVQQISQWENEIVQAEKAFNDMAQKDGLVKAFEHFADPEGVIRRSKKIYKGKQAIADWYEQDVRPNETLTWTPTFVEVSKSGDLGYTYGDFVFTYPDSLGNIKQNTGIFHTVWKRQEDGSWKYVWD